MKYYLFSLILLWILNSCQTQNSNSIKEKNLQQLADKISTELLPDKRDHILEISLTKQANQIILKGFSDTPEILDKLKAKLKSHNINFIDSVIALPTQKFKNLKGITRLSVANLRSFPKHSAELVTQTLLGTPLIPLQEKNGFIRVKTPENYYAWVDKAGVQLLSKKNYDKWYQQKKIIITKLFGTSKANIKNQENIISDYVLNNVLVVTDSISGFYQVKYPDQRKAFIPKKDALLLNNFIKKTKNIKPEMIISQAKKFMGFPYLWGGTSIKGMDCSGFTKTVYACFNYNLPRDASQQAKIGEEIKIDKNNFQNLKSGDLLFFGYEKNGKTKITHVAIHIDNGKIIHSSGEVKIESLNKNDENFNPQRLKTLKSARRIINNFPQNFSLSYFQK